MNPWLMVGVAFASGLALAAHRWTLAAVFAGAAAALLANGLFLNGDARPPGGGDWTVGAIYLLAGVIAVLAFTLGVGIGLIRRRRERSASCATAPHASCMAIADGCEHPINQRARQQPKPDAEKRGPEEAPMDC